MFKHLVNKKIMLFLFILLLLILLSNPKPLQRLLTAALYRMFDLVE